MLGKKRAEGKMLFLCKLVVTKQVVWWKNSSL